MWYLFFAGVGSGASAAAFVIDSFIRRFFPRHFTVFKPLLVPGLVAGTLFVALASVFLYFDLGRGDRLLYLILDPGLSVITVGTWSILAFLLFTFLQLLFRTRFPERIPRFLHIVVRWATALSAFSVMLYTGFLLQSLSVVHFWATPLLPLLFALSSLSGGLALLVLIAFFKRPQGVSIKTLVRLSGAHTPLLAGEMLVMVGYILWAFQRSDVARASAISLISGDYLFLFWGGLVFCGLLLPTVLKIRSRQRAIPNVMAVRALLVLAGALTLRICILGVGMHPDPITSTPVL